MGTAAQDRSARNPQQSVVDQVARGMAKAILEQIATALQVNNLLVDGTFGVNGPTTLSGLLDANQASFTAAVQILGSLTLGTTNLLVETSGADTTTFKGDVLALLNAAGNRTFLSIDNAADTITLGRRLQIPFTTPASSAAAGLQGRLCGDANFLYFWTANNTVKRAALVAF